MKKNIYLFIFLFLMLLGCSSSPNNAAVTAVYQHDAEWPGNEVPFLWGVKSGSKPNPIESAAGIGVDRKNGLVYTLVRKAPHVRVYRESGEFVRSWSPAKVGTMHMIHVDSSGDIWIADFVAHTVSKYTPEGDELMVLGTYGVPGMDGRHFNQPTDIATTEDGEFIFVADGYGNKRIAKFDRTGDYLGMWGGREQGVGPGEFLIPHSITVMDDRVYVADREGGRIQIFDLEGNYLGDWRNKFIPWAVASYNGFVVVAGSRLPSDMDTATLAGNTIKGKYTSPPFPPSRQDVVIYNINGEIINEVSLPQGRNFGEVDWVHAIDLGVNGDIYVADVMGNHIQKWAPQRR